MIVRVAHALAVVAMSVVPGARRPRLPAGARVARGTRFARRVGPAALHAVVPIAICGMWAREIDRVQLREMTDLGLISVLPWSTLVLLFLLTASFCLSLRRRPLGPWIPLVHVLVLIVILYGVTSFLESEPRTGTVWRHVGIIDYIARNGAVDPHIDAYFNWPGFFALGAVISDAAGFATPLAIAGWGPLTFNLLFLPPLIAIFRWASDDPRLTWLGLWVFYSANWVGQDYIAPQAVGYLLWLSMLAALLVWCTPRPPDLEIRPSFRWLLELVDIRRLPARLKKEAESAQPRGSPYRRAGLVITVVVLFAAAVTGHQLTPFFAVLGVTALVVFARLETRGLPLLMILLLASWISYMTTAYLAGHFEVVAGPVTSAGENLNQNITARIGGSSEHEFIVHIRLASSLGIWLLGLAGAVRRLVTGHADLALALLGATPFVLPLIQPYGGEMVLRVYLFALPSVAFFIACLAFPTLAAGRNWWTLAAVMIVCCALLGSFQFTRYGNERLDQFTPGDVAAVNALYRVAPRGTTLIGSQNIPWRQRDYASYKYRSITDLAAWQQPVPDPKRLAREIEDYAVGERSYVVVTRSTRIAAGLLYGKAGALEGLVAVLRTSPRAEQIYHGRDGDVFYIKP
jgi:hypothetical protein